MHAIQNHSYIITKTDFGTATFTSLAIMNHLGDQMQPYLFPGTGVRFINCDYVSITRYLHFRMCQLC